MIWLGGFEMKRRTFTKGLATGLAAPLIAAPVLGPTSALAWKDNDREDMFPARARIALSVLAVTTVLTWILMPGSGGWWGWDGCQDQRHFNERRADLGGILGGLTRPTVQRRLRGADAVGPLLLLNRFLILAPLIEVAAFSLPLFLAHGGTSWDMKKARAVAPRGMPGLAEIQRLQVIGRLYLAAGLLMALIPPPEYQS